MCVVMCTDRVLFQDQPWHSHSWAMYSLYALRDYDPVLLGTTGYNNKIYHPRMQVFDERGRGPCKS